MYYSERVSCLAYFSKNPKMPKVPFKSNPKLSVQIAKETQLLAEEKWIIEALKKIKMQRHSLLIERLHLEDLKNQIKTGGEQKKVDSVVCTPSASQSAVDMMQQNPGSSSQLLQRLVQHEELCNTEELNLAVTSSVFEHAEPGPFDMEEEDDDIENCVIDMSMFMYGKSSSDHTNENNFDD